MIAKQWHQQYIYQSVRDGDTVQRVYIGHVNSPAARQLLQETEAKQALRQERQDLERLASIVTHMSDTVDLLLASQLLVDGYQYRRGEWRKKS